MSEMIKCQEGITNSTISSIIASTPDRCDSIVTVTVNINRRQGDTNLRLEAVLKDPSKVKFVGTDDNRLTIAIPDNMNTASFQVRNITGAALPSAIVFGLVQLKKGTSTLDSEANTPAVTWVDCPDDPCDDCSKCDCSEDITIARCDSVT